MVADVLKAALVLGLLLSPIASLAQMKPTYSDSGEVHGAFVRTDEACLARCGGDRLCAGQCPTRIMTDTEVREMMRTMKAGNSNAH